MTIGFLFWLLMVLWFIFGFWWHWPADMANRSALGPIGGHVLTFILFFLLGWKVFGFVIKDG